MKQAVLIRTLFAMLCLCMTAPAFAQQTKTSSEQSEASRQSQAREWMEKGTAAINKGLNEEARRYFLKSFELHPSFDVAGNLGIVDFELRRYAEAAKYLEYCLDHFPTGENRELKALVEETFLKAKSFVAAVRVKTSEPDASILVNDEDVGFTPMEQAIYLRPGNYTIEAKTEGKSASQTIEAKAGEAQELLLSLVPSNNGLPASGLGEPAVEPVDPLPVEEEAVERNWTPAWILGGVTVASFGTSMVFRALAAGKRNDAEELRTSDPAACSDDGSSGGDDPPCSELQSLSDSNDTYATVGNVTLIASGVAAAATIAYVTYVLTNKSRAPPVQASIGIDRSGGALFLRGQF